MKTKHLFAWSTKYLQVPMVQSKVIITCFFFNTKFDGQSVYLSCIHKVQAMHIEPSTTPLGLIYVS